MPVIPALGRQRQEDFIVKTGLFFFFLAVLGLELRAFTLSHSTSPIFVKGFSRQGLENYFLGWLRTLILLISAS
jgi:hypothetical protein